MVNAAPDRAASVLTAYWTAVERRIAGQRQLVELLQTGLIDGEKRHDDFTVNVREVAEQVVLTAQRHLTLLDLEPWLRRTKIALTDAAGPADPVCDVAFPIRSRGESNPRSHE